MAISGTSAISPSCIAPSTHWASYCESPGDGAERRLWGEPSYGRPRVCHPQRPSPSEPVFAFPQRWRASTYQPCLDLNVSASWHAHGGGCAPRHCHAQAERSLGSLPTSPPRYAASLGQRTSGVPGDDAQCARWPPHWQPLRAHPDGASAVRQLRGAPPRWRPLHARRGQRRLYGLRLTGNRGVPCRVLSHLAHAPLGVCHALAAGRHCWGPAGSPSSGHVNDALHWSLSSCS